MWVKIICTGGGIVGYDVGKVLLNLIFPPKCIFCGKRLSPKTSKYVCAECANELPYCKVYNRCRRCGKPVAVSDTNMCKDCYKRRHYNTRITSAFVYTDGAKRAIVGFKKEKNAGFANTLSAYVAQMVMSDFGGVDFDVVVSVPPRRKGLSDEHFDQAACLAESVARRLGLTYIPNALVQKGTIRKQSSLSLDARIENVRDKFAVKKQNRIEKKTVLLIDDVCTTGVTLEECAKVLKESGAFRVYAATVATVPSI